MSNPIHTPGGAQAPEVHHPAPGSALAILTDLVEDQNGDGDYSLAVSGMSLAMLWEAIEKQEQELQAYRKGGITEEILRRNDGYIKVGHGCAIIAVADVRLDQAVRVAPLIGGMLDAWDLLPADIASMPELDLLGQHIEGIQAEMEGEPNNCFSDPKVG
jgi:hypothetical protein